MEWLRKKSSSVFQIAAAVAVVVLLVLLQVQCKEELADQAGGDGGSSSYSSTPAANGSSTIAALNVEDEFLMDHHQVIRRVLIPLDPTPAHRALGKYDVFSCNKYANCVPNKNGPSPPRQCNTYNRCQRRTS